MVLDRILTLTFIVNLLAATIRSAAPILLSALGEIYTEKSGVCNIGVEGQILCGALTGFLAAYFTGSNLFGFVMGMAGGLLMSLLFAFLTVTLNADQIVVGVTVNIFAAGLTSFIYRVIFGVTIFPPATKPMKEIFIKGLSDIPIIGQVFFQQKPYVYFVFLLVPFLSYLLFKTTVGLKIRSVGENPLAAETVGIPVRLIRYCCILFGGACAGLTGAFLSIAQLTRFMDNMAGGRGFIALAIVIFGQYNPTKAAAAALIFGFADSLQTCLQAVGLKFPEQFLRMAPYLVTILAMVLVSKSVSGPASLSKPYYKE
jgi:simple sugar transport system permease protein